jgi:hypothetical protein
MNKIKMTHMKTPIHRYTFNSTKLRKWVYENVEGKVLNLFAGQTMLDMCNEVRNDIDKDMPADYHFDAVWFCKKWSGDKFNTIILDPPYSYRKSMEKYNGKVMSSFNQLKDEVVRILEPGGIVMTFGYHSVSMGSTRGFEVEQVLVVSHGGAIHDTIGTIERRK